MFKLKFGIKLFLSSARFELLAGRSRVAHERLGSFTSLNIPAYFQSELAHLVLPSKE
ncbi:hypothetical protein Hanom_Chr01g00077111 [Helianthus anomalus]